MRLPQLGVNRPMTVLMLFLGILMLGLVSYTRLPIDLFPNIEPATISVITIYPGASAEDVERQVTEVIENELSIISNLDEITSTSKENISLVSCKFVYGTNLDEAANDMRDGLDFAIRKLPKDVDRPLMFKFDTSVIPILFLGFTAEDSWSRLRQLLEDQVAKPLKRVPGVGAVQIFAGLHRQVNVFVDRGRMESVGVTIEQVMQLLRAANLNVPVGSVKVGKTEYALRVPGEFATIEEIGLLAIKLDTGGLVHLSDIARIEDGHAEQRRVTSINGRHGIMVMVQKQSGANTVRVTSAVRDELRELAGRLPPDVTYQVLADSAEFIERSIDNLKAAILSGAVFVTVVTLAFLRRLIPSLIIIFTIPFSLIVAFLFLSIGGHSINMMSLASLAIALGMVVDNAIVVVENVMTHLDRGVRQREAALFGTSEVGVAISASTFTTVVIFVPLMFVPGIVGIIFRQLGAVISVTLLASLFTALTFTPMLCSKLPLLNAEEMKRRCRPWRRRMLEKSEKAFAAVEFACRSCVGWALRHRAIVVFVAIALFLASLLLVPTIGTEFFPYQDTGELSLTLELRPGTRAEESARLADRMVQMLREIAGEALVHDFYRTGESEGGISTAFGEKEGSHVIILSAKLVPILQRKRSAKDIARDFSEQLWKSFPEISKMSVLAGNPVDQLILGGGKPLSIEILGEDIETTNRVAEQIQRIVANTPGAVDPNVSRDMGKPQVEVVVDRQKAAAVGVPVARVGQALRTYFTGQAVTPFREHGNEYDICVRLDELDRRRIEDVRQMPIESLLGQTVPLATVAEIRHSVSPVEIQRKNQFRMVSVDADSHGRPIGQVYDDIDRQIREHVELPPEVRLQTGGIVKEQLAAFRWLGLALVLGVVLVYMVMAAQFESLLHPFVILFSIPFSFVGVVLALAAAGMTLNVVSMIGAIMLIGIVVNDAIVLVDYTNLLRKRGRPLIEAAHEAAVQRLRPVLLTTVTTVFGMIPLALSRGEGSEVWKPLGIAMISGLLLATLVTLVLVPVVYTLLEGVGERRRYPEA